MFVLLLFNLKDACSQCVILQGKCIAAQTCMMSRTIAIESHSFALFLAPVSGHTLIHGRMRTISNQGPATKVNRAPLQT